MIGQPILYCDSAFRCYRDCCLLFHLNLRHHTAAMWYQLVRLVRSMAAPVAALATYAEPRNRPRDKGPPVWKDRVDDSVLGDCDVHPMYSILLETYRWRIVLDVACSRLRWFCGTERCQCWYYGSRNITGFNDSPYVLCRIFSQSVLYVRVVEIFWNDLHQTLPSAAI